MFFSKNSSKLFLAVSFVIAIIDTAYVVMNHNLTQESFQSNIEREAQTLRFNFATRLEQTYNNLQSLATYVANNVEVQQAFLAGKLAVEAEGGGAGGARAASARNRLHDIVADSWIQVQKKFDTRQLHFHLGPGSTSFLRVHRPEKFGDNMDSVRFTIVDTNQLELPRSGFETGRVYSGLRGVVPVYATDPNTNQRIHVGALETGTSFNAILRVLDNNSPFDVGILLTKEHVQSAMWPDAIERHFSGEEFCHAFIEAASDTNFKQVIKAGCKNKINLKEVGNSVINVNSSNILLSYFPLRDYLGEIDNEREPVGSVVFWQNVDPQVHALLDSQHYNIVYGIAGFFAVELLFFFVFHLTTKHLRRQVKKSTQELSVAKERLTKAQNVALVGNWEVNVQLGEVWWSDKALDILGADKTSDLPTFESFLNFVHPDDIAELQEALQNTLDNHESYDIMHRIIRPSGNEKYVRERGFIELDKKGAPLKIYGTIQDITAEKALENRLERILKVTNSGTWEWWPEEQRIEVNSAWTNMLGYDIKELIPFTIEIYKSILHPDDQNVAFESIIRVLKGVDTHLDMDIRLKRRNGNWIWAHLHGQVIEKDASGRATLLAGTIIDVSDRKNQEIENQRLAITDDLTGLYNRSYLDKKLIELVSTFKRKKQRFALLMLDLDNFKPVNDKYGHPAGDKLLQHIAKKLRDISRESDIIIRFGGDEFIFILPTVDDENGCIRYAQRILEALQKPVDIEVEQVTVGASIGYYLYTNPSVSAADAVNAVDKALYLAKRNGKNCYMGSS